MGILIVPQSALAQDTPQSLWELQSIDTMKTSRDMAREQLRNNDYDDEIEKQVKAIAGTGANYIGINTPYDEEFFPYLSRWVDIARKYNLKVWFRGNFSGWEEWFGYTPITRTQHIQKTYKFITSHPAIFENGDIFTSCPECENGGPGDPRQNGDKKGHQAFLIESKNNAERAFKKINKEVRTNYFPMNGDVAELIMDEQTTKELGGIIVVDHYVKSPQKLNDDINRYADISKGKVILGEFGAPIPDIHGYMEENEQALWLSETLNLLSRNDNLIGLNYWTNTKSSTNLWNNDGQARNAVAIIQAYYTPLTYEGNIKNLLNDPVLNAQIKFNGRTVYSDVNGNFILKVPNISSKYKTIKVNIVHNDYKETYVDITPDKKAEIVLNKKHESLSFKVELFFQHIQKWWQDNKALIF